MTAATMEPTVWASDFATPQDLRRALEEYTAFQDGTLVRKLVAEHQPDSGPIGEINIDRLRNLATRYGVRLVCDEAGPCYGEDGYPLLEVDPEAGPPQLDGLASAEMHAYQRRAEVDACMEILRPRWPMWHRLLDHYYRKGLNLEPRGWAVVAGMLGVHKGKCPPQRRCPASPGDNRSDWPDCRRAERGCLRDHALFMGLLAISIAWLFDAHQVRRGRKA